MHDSDEPLERGFAPTIITDPELRARTKDSLRRVMESCGVFPGDPARTQELLGLIDTYQRFTCPARVDEESLLVGAIYGVVIFLHGVGILTGDYLELTAEQFERCLRTGRAAGPEGSVSARLLAELGRRLQGRCPPPEAWRRFVDTATRTYRAFPEKRARVVSGRTESWPEYERNRAHRIAIFPWVWLWVALDELSLPVLRPRDPRLAELLALTNRITYLRNDIVTLRRDVHDGLDNTVLHLEREHGCDRERALAIAKARTNDELRRFMVVAKEVAASPKEYPRAEEYLGFLGSLLAGNLLALEAFGRTQYVERDTLAS